MEEKINKHELKTRATRTLLLQAAETVFARDGYEGADLAEIAALAGRTKGAIYAQFASKEDIFLAMFEERRDGYRQQMRQALPQSSSVEENLQALRTFYLKQLEDHNWNLLLLEFKLFALRHPSAQKRLQDLVAVATTEEDEQRIEHLLGPAPNPDSGITRLVAVHMILPVLSALVLEARVQQSLMNKDVMRQVANRLFDALLE